MTMKLLRNDIPFLMSERIGNNVFNSAAFFVDSKLRVKIRRELYTPTKITMLGEYAVCGDVSYIYDV